MHNSSLGKPPSPMNIAFLDQPQLQQMSPQQRKWAQTQFRILYAEQMAKLSTELQHQQRIKNNLINKQKEQEQTVRLTSVRLQSKMQGIQMKRQQHFGEKQKAYKMNEQKWTKKISDIETKFRHQNRQAMEKAEKYRQESEDFWKSKESHIATARGTSYQKFDLNKTQKVFGNQVADLMSQSKQRSNIVSIRRSGYRHAKVDTLMIDEPDSVMNSETSRRNLKHSRTIDIDGEISKHKERSEMLHKQRQTLIFQNAMKRLTKIELTRRKAQKLRQPSKSPVQIRKPKTHRHEQQDPYKADSSPTKNHTFHPSKSKESLLNETIQSHIKAKRMIEEQEFRERDKILEGEYKRKRQDKILKVIKNKIKDIKSSTLKMQTLQ